MARLKPIERRQLEDLFEMGGGYVLDFNNSTLNHFVIDSVGRDLYDADKYTRFGDSKANRLRCLWDSEPAPVVAKLVGDLVEYVRERHTTADPRLLEACAAVAKRLGGESPVAGAEAIAQIADDHDLDVVARTVSEAIERAEFVQGLDRLHTFTTKFLRTLCEKQGLVVDRNKPLHSLFGEYVRSLRSAGHIESKMTEKILSSMHGPLDAFNQVRNDQSLAHDNQLLNEDEALLIFSHVTSALRFVRDLDRRIQQKEQDRLNAAGAIGRVQTDDDLF